MNLINPYISFSAVGGFDADYQAILDFAATQGYTIPSIGQRTLQNELVVSLKSGGIWSKLDSLYVHKTDGNSGFASINWKNPILSNVATLVNSPTFVSNLGFRGDGSTSYLEYVMTRVNYTQDNASAGYVLSEINGVVASAFSSVGTYNEIRNNNRYYFNISSTGFVTEVRADAIGVLMQKNRTSSTQINYYIDGVLINTHTQTSISVPSTWRGLRSALDTYTNNALAFVYTGADLTAEAAAFNTALKTYYNAV